MRTEFEGTLPWRDLKRKQVALRKSINRNPELCDQLGMTVSSVNNNKNKTSRNPGENE